MQRAMPEADVAHYTVARACIDRSNKLDITAPTVSLMFHLSRPLVL